MVVLRVPHEADATAKRAFKEPFDARTNTCAPRSACGMVSMDRSTGFAPTLAAVDVKVCSSSSTLTAEVIWYWS